ncbi:hypothetical protein JW979_06355 [bacterium]|nr:hypothetical protein [candidate division CSSED10-310 bacterium]
MNTHNHWISRGCGRRMEIGEKLKSAIAGKIDQNRPVSVPEYEPKSDLAFGGQRLLFWRKSDILPPLVNT